MSTTEALLVFLAFVSMGTSQILSTHGTDDAECISGPTAQYTGTKSETNSGLMCQRWDVRIPHLPRRVPQDGGHHNYCRNPDNDPVGLWCYTTDPDRRWEHCNVTKCPDDSLVVWTDRKNSSANILAMEADPEIVGQRMTQVGQTGVSVLVDSDHVASNYTDVTGSYVEQTIFYPDTECNCIVMTNLVAKTTSKHLFGVAKNIQSIAYDWLNQNLYWIDDVMGTVMVADPTLTFYTSVYRTNQGTLRSLTLDATQKQMFFSMYKPARSCVIRTDLAGRNEKVVFQFPQVYDVTSLTLDPTDHRLYLADFWGQDSLVLSSDMNGASIRRHYYREGAKFVGISAYMDYIYMTDATGRYTDEGEYVHSLVLKSKSSLNTFQYNFDGEPRGMKILSSKGEDSSDAGFGIGDCLGMPPCDQICLPRVDTRRECACSVGYVKSGDTGCVMSRVGDKFFLAVDELQQSLFEFECGPERNVARLELDNHPHLSLVEADAMNSRIWLVNATAPSIVEYSLGGKILSSIPLQSEASSIAIDVINGNVYFVDVTSQSIYVTTRNGRFIRSIPSSSTTFGRDIKMIALDLLNKMMYWTDTNLVEGRGEVWRSDMSGQGKERVMSRLHWPHSITIDYQRNSLFVSEAKRMTVYEVSLESLVNITNHEDITSVTHDLRDRSFRIPREPYVSDIEVRNGTLFFLMEQQLMQLELRSGVVEEFSSPDFYKLSSLALYDAPYQRHHTDSFSNPCRSTNCHSLCLPTSPISATCL